MRSEISIGVIDMRSKTIMCCLLATVLMAGTAASGACAFAANAESNTVFSDNAEVSQKFSFKWDRSDNNGITLKLGTSFDEAVLIRNNRLFASTLNSDITIKKGEITIGVSLLAKLDDGENTIDLITIDKKYSISVNVTNNHPEEVSQEISEVSEEVSDEEFVLSADNTVFEWDRNSGSDIVIMTNSSSKQFTLKNKLLLVSSLVTRQLSIEDGKITIGSELLKKLAVGENNIELILKEGKIDIKIIVTDSKEQEPSEEKIITAEETELTWDRSDLIGIALHTNSSSHNVTITKNGEPFASNKDIGVYIIKGRVGMTASILKALDDGENSLVFEFDDGKLPVNIFVTDKMHEDSAELTADETNFVWSRSSDSGIVIQTNSKSKSFAVKKDNILLASSLLSKNLSIEDGMITLDADFLKKLGTGDNSITLMLKEGCIDINIKIVDDGGETPENTGNITADETYFNWDRSDLIGIAVKTNSRSRNLAVMKDGQELFSTKDKGVYVIFGRAGIIAPILRKLENGENHLIFRFDDGDLPVTINVTDRRNKSGASTGLTADRSVFTWKRNSTEGITIKTNSVSGTASVRRSGMLSLISKPDSISINNGEVTLTPDYLNTLKDGKNNLTLVMEDGNIDIIVNVVGNVIEQSYSLPSSSSYSPLNPGVFGNYPKTGGTALALGAAITAVSSGIVGIIASKKRKNKKR